MTLKPLYLAHGRDAHVHHDGPALRVNVTGKAAALFPFQRLSRVVSASDVHWHDDSLLACLQAGVPVCFLDGHGHPLAHCYGVRRRETTLEGLLLEAVQDVGWDDRYRTWFAGMDSQAMRAALAACGLRCQRPLRQSARSAFCNAYFRTTGTSARHLFTQLEGCLDAWACQRLAKCISHPDLLGFPVPGLSFVADIAGLLSWTGFSLLLRETPRHPDERDDERYVALWLQRNSKQLQVEYDEIMRRLELWLRSWVL